MTATAPIEGEIVETTAVAVRSQRAVAEWEPELADVAVERAVSQVRMRDRFMHDVMRDGFDYGVIPGTKKPTLLKPGAERLLAAYGLHAVLEDEDAPIVNFETGVFLYRRRCKVYRQTGPAEQDRILVAQASGACSSFEEKYRYRNRWENGKKVKDPNPNPADVLNTVLKMADKRAMIAATIIATGWSDMVTQDMEDVVDAPPAARPAAGPVDAGDHTDPSVPPAQPRAAKPAANVTYPADSVPELGKCAMCGGFFFAKKSRKDGSTYYQCKGKRSDGTWCNSFAERDLVRQYEDGLFDAEPAAGGDIDPDDIPF